MNENNHSKLDTKKNNILKRKISVQNDKLKRMESTIKKKL